MSIVLYHATGPAGLNYIGELRDEVVGRAGDHWSVTPDGPIRVYETYGIQPTLADCQAAQRNGRDWHYGDYRLIWYDGQPWPRRDQRKR